MSVKQLEVYQDWFHFFDDIKGCIYLPTHTNVAIPVSTAFIKVIDNHDVSPLYTPPPPNILTFKPHQGTEYVILITWQEPCESAFKATSKLNFISHYQ